MTFERALDRRTRHHRHTLSKGPTMTTPNSAQFHRTMSDVADLQKGEAASTGDPATGIQQGTVGVLRKTFAAGAGGAASDVTLLASAEFPIRVLDVILYVKTGVALSTITLRNAAAGAGAALSSAMSAATAGKVRDAGLSTGAPLVAAAAPLVARLSDSGIAGEIVVLFVRETA